MLIDLACLPFLLLAAALAYYSEKEGSQKANSQSDSSDSEKARAAANSKKGKQARSISNYKDCDPTDYALIRQKNWYLQPREDLDDQTWYNWEQECIYKDIYVTMKHPVRPMSAINLDKLEKKK